MFDGFVEDWDRWHARQRSSDAAERAALVAAIRMMAWFGAILAAAVAAVIALGWLDGPAFGDTTGAALFAGITLTVAGHAS